MGQQTVNNGDSGLVARGKINDNFTELYTGKDSVTVANYAALPDPTTVSGERYWVLASTGVFLVNRKSKGAYYSDGVAWSYLGDYPTTADQLGNVPAGGIAATDVQAALNELDSEKLAASSYTAADVLAKLLTVDGSGSGLDADLLDGNSSAAFATAGHVHAASAITFTPAGNLAADDVQEALQELDTEKLSTSGNAATTTKLATARTIAMTGDVTWNSGSFDGSANVTAAGTIADDAVTYAKMQNVSATSRFLGRITAAAGNVEELTGAQAASLLLGGADTQIQYNNAGAFGGSLLWQGTNEIVQKNTTNAQKFTLTMTDDDAGNYRRGFLHSTGGYFVIDTTQGGTGASMNILMRVAGSNQIELTGSTISAYTKIRPASNNAYDLGESALGWKNAFFTSYVRFTGKTVASLTAAATAGAGARDFVTDALTPAFGSAVTGGGAVNVPVYSDGSGWFVG